MFKYIIYTKTIFVVACPWKPHTGRYLNKADQSRHGGLFSIVIDFEIILQISTFENIITIMGLSFRTDKSGQTV